jgi:hypothetical protein
MRVLLVSGASLFPRWLFFEACVCEVVFTQLRVWRVSGACLACVWRLSAAWCVWCVSGACLARVWCPSGACLVRVSVLCVWCLSGACLARVWRVSVEACYTSVKSKEMCHEHGFSRPF